MDTCGEKIEIEVKSHPGTVVSYCVEVKGHPPTTPHRLAAHLALAYGVGLNGRIPDKPVKEG